jgi:uncharacterized membrane protein YqgA involved in biofilm formation
VEFWLRTSGTWINVLTVTIGTVFGLSAGRYLPLRVQRSIAQGIGLLTLWIGFSMAGSLAQSGTDRVEGVILGLIAIVVGGAIGELIGIEERLIWFGDRLRRWVNGSGAFTEGFVTASLLFCVGPMTLIGCLNNGLSGDNTLIVLKASMDGITAIALSSIYGVGVGASILTIAVYQGSISLLAGQLAGIIPDPASDPRILLLTGVGGLMVLGTGINLLELGKVRVASFLPSLAIAPLLHQWATFLNL